jgi:hypothetical protein
VFGRRRQKLGGSKDRRQAAFGRRAGLDEVCYCLAQGRQLGAFLQHDRLSKTRRPGRAATPQQGRNGPSSGGRAEAALEVDVPGRPGTSLSLGSQSADPIKFCFRSPAWPALDLRSGLFRSISQYGELKFTFVQFPGTNP